MKCTPSIKLWLKKEKEPSAHLELRRWASLVARRTIRSLRVPMGNQQATPLRLAASISLLISSSPFLSAHSLSSCRSHHRSKSYLHLAPPHPHAACSLCGQCCRHVASAAGLQTFQNTRGSICKMEIILLRGHGLECEADKSEAHRCKGGEARRCVTERLNEIKRCAKSGLAQPRR